MTYLSHSVLLPCLLEKKNGYNRQDGWASPPKEQKFGGSVESHCYYLLFLVRSSEQHLIMQSGNIVSPQSSTTKPHYNEIWIQSKINSKEYFTYTNTPLQRHSGNESWAWHTLQSHHSGGRINKITGKMEAILSYTANSWLAWATQQNL